MFASTFASIDATPTNSVPAASTPSVPPLAFARALLPSLRVFASTTIAPDPFSVEPEPTVVWMFAPESIVAVATPPDRPMTETPKMVVLAVAVLSAIALIVMSVAFLMLPSTVVVVCPERPASATITAIPMPPNAPPGASASTELLAVAFTTAGAGVVKVTSPEPETPASVLRELSILSTVIPTAPTPVAMLTLLTFATWTPSAVTLRPPPPTEPCAPDEAVSVPPRLMTATAAPMPTPMPPATEITSVSETTWSIAETLMPLTGPAPPTATLPIFADASPLTLTTATAAPTAKAPAATPIA